MLHFVPSVSMTTQIADEFSRERENGIGPSDERKKEMNWKKWRIGSKQNVRHQTEWGRYHSRSNDGEEEAQKRTVDTARARNHGYWQFLPNVSFVGVCTKLEWRFANCMCVCVFCVWLSINCSPMWWSILYESVANNAQHGCEHTPCACIHNKLICSEFHSDFFFILSASFLSSLDGGCRCCCFHLFSCWFWIASCVFIHSEVVCVCVCHFFSLSDFFLFLFLFRSASLKRRQVRQEDISYARASFSLLNSFWKW